MILPRSPLTRWAAVAAVALAALACTPERSARTGFPLAYFHDDCAPWDGRALTLVLTHAQMESVFDAHYPFLRVTLNRPPARLPGTSASWQGDAQSDGYATLCTSADLCTRAHSASIDFDRRQENDGRLSGELRVELEDGQTVAGRFDAAGLRQEMLCG